ncbi:hypothetical protein AnigIFM60653_011923 [Aspergillus niger]|nr:hypothetical protein AnigIFM60653_011923 [Aspergillus niger]GLA14556.1 hypothetical protein AnigIFM62618_000938 [Aspergillus niger]GLA33786.1 hypothetical protein AnigIFM63309_003807 [Aspergillus niger]
MDSFSCQPRCGAHGPRARALLIASPYSSLKGLDKDIEVISGVLDLLGFSLSKCFNQSATCRGIWDALKAFQQDTKPTDCVFIYYTGHGGIVKVDDTSTTTPPFEFQFLVPIDYGISNDDIRAIVDVELSHYLRDLTAITENVTVLLDCCHSSGLARDGDLHIPGLEVKGLDPVVLKSPSYEGLRSHIKSQYARKELLGTTFTGGNPHVVRISAACRDESAWVYDSEKHGKLSVLTDAFSQVILSFTAAGVPQSWRTIIATVAAVVERKALLNNLMSQRVEVAGPYRRLMFDTRECDILGMVDVELRPGSEAILLAGHISGVEVGDSYALVYATEALLTTGTPFANATVVAVNLATATVRLSVIGPLCLELEARAFCVPLRRARRAIIHVLGPDCLRSGAQELIDKSPFCVTADPCTKVNGRQSPMASLVVESDRVVILDDQEHEMWFCEGSSLGKTWYLEEGLRRAIFQLDVYAQGIKFRALKSRLANRAIGTELLIEWGVIRSDKQEERQNGDVVLEGEAIFVKIWRPDMNDDEPVYVSIFDIGLAGTVTQLTTRTASSEEIPISAPFILGTDNNSGELIGIPMEYPPGVPKCRARLETLLLIFTTKPLDLSFMDTNINWEDVIRERREYDESDLLCQVESIEFLLEPLQT